MTLIYREENAELLVEIKRLQALLKLPDVDRRQHFITDTLTAQGYINRIDLCTEYNVSVPQASIDLQRWIKNNPDQISYNKTTKRYESKRWQKKSPEKVNYCEACGAPLNKPLLCQCAEYIGDPNLLIRQR